MPVVSKTSVLCCVAAALTFAQVPVFDAAAVKVVNLASHPVFGKSGGPGTDDPGRIHICCVGMFSLLMRAYDVELDQISGPSWIMENMGPTLYQIDATMPAGTTSAELQLMMRNLLEERFHLKVHRAKRGFPGYELVVAEGGPKLKEPTIVTDAVSQDVSPMPRRGADGTLTLPPGSHIFTSLGRGMVIVQAQEEPISELVARLGRLIAQSLGEDANDFSSPKPRVADRTGLTRKYNFTLRFSCDRCQFAAVNGAMTGPPEPADSSAGLQDIFVAIQKQLGLKLVKTRDIPLDVIVVDHVDKIPTAN